MKKKSVEVEEREKARLSFLGDRRRADEACLAGSGTQTAGSLRGGGRWSGAGSGGRQGRRQRTRCNV